MAKLVPLKSGKERRLQIIDVRLQRLDLIRLPHPPNGGRLIHFPEVFL